MSVFELWVYFVLLPAISATGALAVTILVSTMTILIVALIIAEGDKTVSGAIRDGIRKYKTVFYILLLVAFIGGVSPSEKQVALIVGGSVVTNVEGVEELPENIVNAANNYLKAIEQKD